MRRWIKSPLAGMPEGAAGGLVTDGAVIAEFIPTGGQPAAPVDEVFDASAHIVLPGLINTHHHFYQTLTRAYRPAVDRKLFDWLVALYPVWARLTEAEFRVAARLALAELLLSGCTTAADHHYLFPEKTAGCDRYRAAGGGNAGHPRRAVPRLDGSFHR